VTTVIDVLSAAAQATGKLTWLDVVVLAIFAVGIVLVVLVPFTIDVLASHKTYRELLASNPAPKAGEPHGMQGSPAPRWRSPSSS
jgi:hypothetical protein